MPDDFLITLVRTSCFGECPVYSVSIDAKGNVSVRIRLSSLVRRNWIFPPPDHKWNTTRFKSLSMVTSDDFECLRQVREGWYVEYKREATVAAAIAKSISAFANTRGGWLFYGIDAPSDSIGSSLPDNRSITAIKVAARLRCGHQTTGRSNRRFSRHAPSGGNGRYRARYPNY
jgi:hypothetical protein